VFSWNKVFSRWYAVKLQVHKWYAIRKILGNTALWQSSLNFFVLQIMFCQENFLLKI